MYIIAYLYIYIYIKRFLFCEVQYLIWNNAAETMFICKFKNESFPVDEKK